MERGRGVGKNQKAGTLPTANAGWFLWGFTLALYMILLGRPLRTGVTVLTLASLGSCASAFSSGMLPRDFMLPLDCEIEVHTHGCVIVHIVPTDAYGYQAAWDSAGDATKQYFSFIPSCACIQEEKCSQKVLHSARFTLSRMAL
jgi:hypothetical protein